MTSWLKKTNFFFHLTTQMYHILFRIDLSLDETCGWNPNRRSESSQQRLSLAATLALFSRALLQRLPRARPRCARISTTFVAYFRLQQPWVRAVTSLSLLIPPESFCLFFRTFCCFKLCADIMFVVCLVTDLLLPLLFLFRSFSHQSTLNVVTQEDHNICSGFPFFFFFFL